MVMTDPISDMLTRMRNALMSRHARTEMPASSIKVQIAKILKEEGYIEETSRSSTRRGAIRRLVVDLRYGPGGEAVSPASSGEPPRLSRLRAQGQAAEGARRIRAVDRLDGRRAS